MSWIFKALAYVGSIVSNGLFGVPPGTLTGVGTFNTITIVKITEFVHHIPIVVPTVTVTATVAYITPNPVVTGPFRAVRPYPLPNVYASAIESEPSIETCASFADGLPFLSHWLTEARISAMHILTALSLVLSVFCIRFLVFFPIKKSLYSRANRLRNWYLDRLESRCIRWNLGPNDLNLGPFPVTIITLVLRSLQLTMFTVYFPRVALQITAGFVRNLFNEVCNAIDMLLAETITRFPRRAEDFVKAVFDVDEFSWRTMLTALNVVRETILWLALIVRSISASVLSFSKFLARLYVHRVLLEREREEVMQRTDWGFTKASKAAWKWVFNASYQQMVDKVLDLQELQAKFDALEAKHQELLSNFPEQKLRELAEVAKAYRASLIAAVADINYWRTILCQIMNWQHNICTGRSISGPDSQHPYRNSRLKFSAEANSTTGLHYTMIEATESQKRVKADWISHTVAFYWDKKKNFFRMPHFMERKLAGADNYVPDGLDPFKEDTWVIEANFPGIQLMPFDAKQNPINLSKKRPIPIANPEKRFGRLIEDVASSGSLMLWRKPVPEKRFPLGNNYPRRHMSLLQTTPMP